MRPAEILREETKRRSQGEWKGKLAKIGMWFQAADYLDENTPREPNVMELEVLAEALRADNLRAHEDSGWDSATEQVKTLWRERAVRVQAAINSAEDRRR